jgi:uracil-DNA glycosylase
MKPFFDKNKIKSSVDPRNTQSCASCGLYKKCLSPRMPPFGKNKQKVMFLGEAPGELEDKRNKPWQGKVGSLLKRTLRELDFDLFEDGISTNSCNCRPVKNTTPKPVQINCCRPRVQKAIKEYKPEVIILLGNVPIESVIGNKWRKDLGGVTKWRGWCIPDQDLGAWICPVYHPSFVSRNEEKNGLNLAQDIWKRDLYNALKCLDRSFPYYQNLEDQITYIQNDDHLFSTLPQMKNAELLSFDYETTGLKPQRKEQKIVSVSAAIKDHCFVWMNDSPKKRKLWKSVLKSGVPKTAHNIQFEEVWSRVKFKTEVKNWKICTMNSSHCLDNRKGITGLKFQTYVNFGIPDYDSHINPYLSSTNEDLGSNSINKIQDFIDKFGTKDLLKYNALDSIFGLMLAEKHIKMIGL